MGEEDNVETQVSLEGEEGEEEVKEEEATAE